MSEFEGRVSFVTGAGSGIGQAMALKLATEGSTVVCSDINEQTAQATAARAKEAGAQAVANALDPADEVLAKARQHGVLVAPELGTDSQELSLRR